MLPKELTPLDIEDFELLTLALILSKTHLIAPGAASYSNFKAPLAIVE
jgi:hypothetical protein